ncbi:mitochondrial carrier domain-containing protein, partial [Jimgerdemannia flammicorona]
MTTKILVASKDQTSQGRVHDTTSSFSNRARGFAAGVASGITKLVVGHPFDTIKVRLQTSGAADGRFAGPLDCLKSTLRQVCRRAPFFHLEVVLLLQFKSILTPITPDQFNSARCNATASRMDVHGQHHAWYPSQYPHASTTIQRSRPTPLHFPAWSRRTRWWVNGLLSCHARRTDQGAPAGAIHNNGFFRGLWKGLVPTMLFRSWFFVFWSSYEVYGRELRKRGYSDSAVSFIAGGVCANTFWLGGFPFDVVKNRIMTQPDVKPPRFPTMRSCAEFVYRTG